LSRADEQSLWTAASSPKRAAGLGLDMMSSRCASRICWAASLVRLVISAPVSSFQDAGLREPWCLISKCDAATTSPCARIRAPRGQASAPHAIATREHRHGAHPRAAPTRPSSRATPRPPAPCAPSWILNLARILCSTLSVGSAAGGQRAHHGLDGGAAQGASWGCERRRA